MNQPHPVPERSSPSDLKCCSLIILRHAKSSWRDPTLKDFDRPLNRRGERDAVFMGQRIAKLALTMDRILCSPALRTRLTLSRMTPYLEYTPRQVTMHKELYHAPLPTLIKLLREQNERSIMIVGHNPGLEDLIEWMSQGEISRLPTCAFGVFHFPFQYWDRLLPSMTLPTEIQLKTFEYPKMFPQAERYNHPHN